MNPAYRNYAFPGRACGACTACCTHLAIDSDGLSKLAGASCQHCTAGSGCAIYETRPQVCRTYHCVWRGMAGLDESWRPDRSGVMIVWSTPPPGVSAEYAVDLIIIGPPDIVESDAFAGLATGFIVKGVATFLDLPRGPGFLSTNAYINPLLAPAIAARSRPQAKALLRAAFAGMMARPPKAVAP